MPGIQLNEKEETQKHKNAKVGDTIGQKMTKTQQDNRSGYQNQKNFIISSQNQFSVCQIFLALTLKNTKEPQMRMCMDLVY